MAFSEFQILCTYHQSNAISFSSPWNIYIVWDGDKIILSYVDINLSQNHSLKRLFSQLNGCGTLVWTLILYRLSTFQPYSKTTLFLITHCFAVCFEMEKWSLATYTVLLFSNLFWLFRVLFNFIWILWSAHTFLKKNRWSFDWSYIQSVGQFEECCSLNTNISQHQATINCLLSLSLCLYWTFHIDITIQNVAFVLDFFHSTYF